MQTNKKNQKRNANTSFRKVKIEHTYSKESHKKASQSEIICLESDDEEIKPFPSKKIKQNETVVHEQS